MEGELTNRLAGLVSGTLDAQERSSLAEALAREPESRDVLALLKGIGAEAMLACSPPFPIARWVTLEVGEESLFPYILDGIGLVGLDSDVRERVARISGGRLPAWFKGRLSLSVPLGPPLSALHLNVSCRGDGVSVQVEDSPRPGANLEVWKDDVLMRRAPTEAYAKRPVSGIPVGSALAFRTGEDDEGFLIHFRKVELERTDRWGLCLVSVLRGHFAEAIAALRTSATDEDPGVRSGLFTGIQIVSELFQSVRLELQPAPTLRGSTDSSALQDLAVSLIRDGIKRAWPEHPVDSTSPAPSDVQALTAAASAHPSTWLSDQLFSTRSSDPRVQEAHAALRGWGFLLRGDSEAAAVAFGSIHPADYDPFNLQFALAVARRLAQGGEGSREDAGSVSTEQIWSALFSRLVDSL